MTDQISTFFWYHQKNFISTDIGCLWDVVWTDCRELVSPGEDQDDGDDDDDNDNKIILDECSTVVEIDHVRNLKDCLERKNG